MTPIIIASNPATPRVRQLQAALAATIAAAPPLRQTTQLVVWSAPWERATPLPAPGQGVHVLDLSGAVAACPSWGAAAQAAWCATIAATCQGAALLLVGSSAELGFWSALLGPNAPPVAILPYTPQEHPKPPPGPAKKLHIAGRIANPALRPVLDAAIAWAQQTGLEVITQPSTAIDRLAAARAPSTQAKPAAAILLDLREDTPPERAATPQAVIDALAAGMHILSTVDGALTQAIAAASAGQILTAGFAPTAATANPAAPAAFLRAHVENTPTLLPAIERAQARDAAIRATWRRAGPRPPQPLGPQGQILVLSEESSNLGAVRVHLPFGALHHRGAIGGYAVLRGGKIEFDTRPASAPQRFDAIWVHRSMDPGHRLLLTLLGRPYAYDVDDNLLAAPSYRDKFNAVARRAARDMLQSATTLSCATPRLARLLGARAETRLADRLVITPNLAQDRTAPREAATARAIIWASSDQPALTSSRDTIVRAVRDHCLAHGVKLVCIGAAPPAAFVDSGIELEAIGLLPHAAYREYLRGLSPAIMVCPLETGADPETQDFIDGKSDIKIIEALSYGLVGVFSRANPYMDSDLPPQILCDNTYESWLDGLEAARAACLSPALAQDWPEARDSAGPGLAPWSAALAAIRLPAPIGLDEIKRALETVRLRESPLLNREEFDEDYYIDNYDDVRDAVAKGLIPSAYHHYDASGRAERRLARKRRTPGTASETWWDNLLHEVSQVEAATAIRTREIAALEQRLALRRTLGAARR